jgi:Fuc2NAc and GlcNAc transferase
VTISLPILFILVCAAASAALTGLIRRLAWRHGMVDVPNQRSSHQVVTARGGGLAIVLVVLAGAALLALDGILSERLFVALASSSGMVAAIGWIDDRRHVPAPIRFGIHLVAAAVVVLLVDGTEQIVIGAGAVYVGAAGAAIAVLGVVWGTNLYNFMDGTDGLAASEAVIVAGAAALLLLQADEPGLAGVAALLAAGSAGFLIWNWQPAKIFMGDVGSGFIGFLIAALAVAAWGAGALSPLTWLVLLGGFVGDATITLVRRVMRGEKWYSAHRMHAYQRLAGAGWSHSRVALGMMGLNLALVTLAVTGENRPSLMPYAVGAAAALVVIAYVLVERRAPMRNGPVNRLQDRRSSHFHA